jgi:hypothetical protein
MRKSLRLIVHLIILLFVFSTPHVIAQGEVGYRLDKILQAPKPGMEGWFGNSVAMDASRRRFSSSTR